MDNNNNTNNDEFAKLDALLADLLSEVEQPILLNPKGALTNWDHQQQGYRGKSSNKCEILKNLDDIERSVDYLNEQKEKLKSKKDIIFEEEDLDSQQVHNNQSFRQVKSKFDYYLSNSNEKQQNQDQIKTPHYVNSSMNATSYNRLNNTIEQQQKPPISPNTYSKFYLKNDNHGGFQVIQPKNETDDEFECSSVKSGFSTASAVQRSKYHTICNNYVDSTGPKFIGSKTTHNKRAFSAPPTDAGKIVLQRMELKSPLTIKTGSNMSMNQPPNNENKYLTTNNRYNNRNVLLKTNTLQPQPQRITRALSERPQNIVSRSGGYDTDTGVLGYNQQQQSMMYRNNYRRRNDSDTESLQIPFQTRYSNDTNKRYIDQSGYDTDTGLINARKSLNERLISTNPSKLRPNSNLDKDPLFMKNSSTKLDNIVNINSNFKYNGSATSTPTKQLLRLSSENNNQNIVSLNELNEQNRQLNDDKSKSAFQSISSIKTMNNQNKSNEIQSSNEQKKMMLAVNNQVFDTNRASKQKSRSPSVTSITQDANDVFKPWKNVSDTQNYWYKPKISREDAINLLKDKSPGAFLIRDSNNFPGAYGLALKVEKLPPNVPIKSNADQSVELVRHFLIEPTSGGVRIKGCCNEPVFINLAALVYQHSITPLALSCRLILPANDVSVQNSNKQNKIENKPVVKSTPDPQSPNQLLEKGAACHVYYLNTINVGNMTGYLAINKALESLNTMNTIDNSQLVLIQFKVNSQGVFISDLNRKKFLRNHFPTETVTFCAIDDRRIWPNKIGKIEQPRIFGIICKSVETNGKSNNCHLFVEIDPDQPAIAIVDFINRYLIPYKQKIQNE